MTQYSIIGVVYSTTYSEYTQESKVKPSESLDHKTTIGIREGIDLAEHTRLPLPFARRGGLSPQIAPFCRTPPPLHLRKTPTGHIIPLRCTARAIPMHRT